MDRELDDALDDLGVVRMSQRNVEQSVVANILLDSARSNQQDGHVEEETMEPTASDLDSAQQTGGVPVEGSLEETSGPVVAADNFAAFATSDQSVRCGEFTPFEASTSKKGAPAQRWSVAETRSFQNSFEQFLIGQDHLTKQRSIEKRQRHRPVDQRPCSTASSSRTMVGSGKSSELTSGQQTSDSLSLALDQQEVSNEKRLVKLQRSDAAVKESAELHGNRSTVGQRVRPKRHRDDSSLRHYRQRLKKWNDESAERDGDVDVRLEGGLVVPGWIWSRLFLYQQTGVRWLWELHQQQVGGIVGDEMGLGKTIQVIGFLAALQYSKFARSERPNEDGSAVTSTGWSQFGLDATIIVCPATVLDQWVGEFHTWWPPLRVAVLHHSSQTTLQSRVALVQTIFKAKGVLITTYTTFVSCLDAIMRHHWHYVVLDEGHKIRNPDTQVTSAVKQFATPHRLILSGSPIQNNLRELWSLFDFIFPGKLGQLNDFMENFGVPIAQGGYSNASDTQVRTSYKCASVLRDTIKPYLLRRVKADVDIQLPGKNEQVLFCHLTEYQRQVYVEYLRSRECEAIMDGRLKVFVGLITLRKICNHPDLATGGADCQSWQDSTGRDDKAAAQYGYWKRSGKMIVLDELLKLWRKQAHRVLLFSQSRQMLDVIELLVKSRRYNYLRMDGSTPIAQRQSRIAMFNSDTDLFVFLLTTRVGGLGVNLTGADRVLIFDPDWNPSTDVQARERAWRIGQLRHVTVYRLVTSGTIEEKIYHRQIFKQFLTNRILSDPKQRRFFKKNDLLELFTLGSDATAFPDSTPGAGRATETSALFAGTNSDVKLLRRSQRKEALNRFDEMRRKQLEESTGQLVDSDDEMSTALTEDEREQLRRVAREWSRNCSQSISELKEKIVQPSVVEKKQKRKKSRKPPASLLDGKFSVKNLAKQESYQPGPSAELSAEQHQLEDDYVLRKLFRRNGQTLHSAMHHDNIMQAGLADYALVEAEAERVARQAAAAVRLSRRSIMSEPGKSASKRQFGKVSSVSLSSTSAVSSAKRGRLESSDDNAGKTTGAPISSSMLLKQLRQTQFSVQPEVEVTEAREQQRRRNELDDQPDDDVETEVNTRYGAVGQRSIDSDDIEITEADRQLIEELRVFIRFGAAADNRASSDEISEEFGSRLPPGSSAKFKAMLQEICTFETVGKTRFWSVKPDYL